MLQKRIFVDKVYATGRLVFNWFQMLMQKYVVRLTLHCFRGGIKHSSSKKTKDGVILHDCRLS